MNTNYIIPTQHKKNTKWSQWLKINLLTNENILSACSRSYFLSQFVDNEAREMVFWECAPSPPLRTLYMHLFWNIPPCSCMQLTHHHQLLLLWCCAHAAGATERDAAVPAKPSAPLSATSGHSLKQNKPNCEQQILLTAFPFFPRFFVTHLQHRPLVCCCVTAFLFPFTCIW